MTNWAAILITYHDKFERIPALIKLWPFMPERDRMLWLGKVWRNNETIYLHMDALQPLLMHAMTSPLRGLLMPREDRATFREQLRLNKPLRVFRGCSEGNRDGWSWTLDRTVAEKLGTRHPFDGKPLLVSGFAAPEDVLAYFDTRREREILINPFLVTRVRVQRLKPLSNALQANGLFIHRIQAGLYTSPEEQEIRTVMTTTTFRKNGGTVERAVKIFQERIDAFTPFGDLFADKIAENVKTVRIIEDVFAGRHKLANDFENSCALVEAKSCSEL